MSAPRVSVVVVTYNRPRLLRECLLSVAAARPDEIIVCDDGSDCRNEEGRAYSVHRTACFALYYRVKYAVLTNEPITPAERMNVPRQGALINRALALAEGEIATLICDDDLMHPGWCDALRAHWTEYPERELARGSWLWFEEGETPDESCEDCPLDARQMTAGNFAWHSSLTRERGVKWPEHWTNCLDDGFLSSCVKANVAQLNVPHVGAVAGWRREHAKANGNYANGRGGHKDEFLAVLEAGRLE